MFGDSADELFKSGLQQAESGNAKKAFSYFKNAAKKAPDSARYHFAAAQTAPDQNTAFMYTKFAWEKGLKNQVVFTLLLKYSFHLDKEKKLEYALSLYKELPDSIANDVFKGELYFQFDKPDSAYALWHSEFVRTEKTFLGPKIANALTRMGKPEQAIDFLYKCKKDQVIDSDGLAYLASLLAIQYNFKDVERLFTEISSTSYFTDQVRLEYATYCAFNDRFDDAMRLIANPAGPGSKVNKALLNFRFTTLKIYIAMMKNDSLKVQRLLAEKSSDTLDLKIRKDIFEGINAYVKRDTSALTLMKKAITVLPADPVTLLLCADAAVKKKSYAEAASYYDRLPGIVLWAPRIVVSRAQTLAMAGQDDEALKVISFMHKSRVFTRPSLELFRNLTLKKDLLDKSNAAQQMLEKQYSNDVGLKWKGLLLAIKGEKYDSALTISQELNRQYPDDERFVLTQLTLLLMKKEYRRVLEMASKSTLPATKIKPIEAAAFKGLGDTAMAIAAYESVVKERKDPILVMQLAEMYFQKKMYAKAQSCYSNLIKEKTDSLSKDTMQLAILLNNNAWTIMSAGAQDLSGALTMANRAYEIAPENLHILDTYISILYEAGKYKECISILEGNKSALQQKRLLCHLAKSYEKSSNLNKAKRYFEDALIVKKEDQKLSLLLSDEQIKNEIARLSQ